MSTTTARITRRRLIRSATLIGHVMIKGTPYPLFEDPDFGDEECLWTIVDGAPTLTGFWETPDENEVTHSFQGVVDLLQWCKAA